MEYRLGFTLGKFIPPHAGHLHLVKEGARRCKRFIVLVCSTDREPIPGGLRYRWMQDLVEEPNVEVVHVTDEVPSYPREHPDFASIWIALLKRVLPEGVDAFFSSEEYGADVARWLGVADIRVDQARHKYPVSGTVVRERPLAVWVHVPSPVRPYLLPRIAIVGGEACGKSTLSRILARRLDAPLVAEYGREYSVGMGVDDFTGDDLVAIARGHAHRVEEVARTAYPCLISDTEAIVTAVWSEALFGSAPAAVEGFIRRQRFDLYLILAPTVPWRDDGTRVFRSRREWFYRRIRERVEDIGGTAVSITDSDYQKRFQRALIASHQLLRDKGFGPRRFADAI